MMIIPFYSFVLMELVKPGWFRWVKARLDKSDEEAINAAKAAAFIKEDEEA